ncbi:hypothetical protein BDY21DRAFT_89527 [Lineolata rhizophorae]|uniref:Uncharacterized protein n=1 Tax=Lineolata rhizophorae TaxID=578093 RepID=A0A6A6PC34_9PEZI|nr:hypothetical protein BDY21DRAFT_89527 [Lineolata rhizophorae]
MVLYPVSYATACLLIPNEESVICASVTERASCPGQELLSPEHLAPAVASRPIGLQRCLRPKMLCGATCRIQYLGSTVVPSHGVGFANAALAIAPFLKFRSGPGTGRRRQRHCSGPAAACFTSFIAGLHCFEAAALIVLCFHSLPCQPACLLPAALGRLRYFLVLAAPHIPFFRFLSLIRTITTLLLSALLPSASLSIPASFSRQVLELDDAETRCAVRGSPGRRSYEPFGHIA